MRERATIGVTMGDPAGIGPEIIVKAYPELVDIAKILVLGDVSVLEAAASQCRIDLPINSVPTSSAASFDSGRIDVLNFDNVAAVVPGEVRADYGRASLDYVRHAIDLAVDGTIDAITTAPIHKEAIRLGGAQHTGHTELLADRTGTDSYAMMLVNNDFRVSHVTTHLPLREAIERITEDAVYRTIHVTDSALPEFGVDEPSILVAGLNPHAGDHGVIGAEDERDIRPAIERAQRDGVDVGGPEPPDTVFAQAAGGAADCVIAMYHDQGHIPVKMLGIAANEPISGVNVTIGLPIVRTSVDHGTAFDIAGECVASETSLIDAVSLAAQLVANRARQARG